MILFSKILAFCFFSIYFSWPIHIFCKSFHLPFPSLSLLSLNCFFLSLFFLLGHFFSTFLLASSGKRQGWSLGSPCRTSCFLNQGITDIFLILVVTSSRVQVCIWGQISFQSVKETTSTNPTAEEEKREKKTQGVKINLSTRMYYILSTSLTCVKLNALCVCRKAK